MNLTHISYSQITEYLACPYRWWISKVEGIKHPPTIPMTKGVLIHEALDRYTKWYLETTKHDVEQMSSIWKDVNSDISLSDISLPLSDYVDGLSMLKNLILSDKLDLSGTILSEQEFVMPVGSAIIKGRVDRVDFSEGYYRIVDYKSGYIMSSDVEKELELDIYALALSDYIRPSSAYNQPINVAIHNIRYGAIIDVWKTPEDLQNTRDYLQSMWTKMTSIEKYEPIPCEACMKYDGCWMSHRCDAHKITFNLGSDCLDLSSMSEDEIKEKINTLELWVKQLKKKISLPRKAKTYNIKKADVKKLNEILIENGYVGYVDITPTNIESVYKDIKDFFNILLSKDDNEFLMGFINSYFEKWGVKIN
jgi:CRISPR/Cas system-associated exonuclease Cas4 (RecB family)